MKRFEIEYIDCKEDESELERLYKIVVDCIKKKEDRVVGNDEIVYFILSNNNIVIESCSNRGLEIEEVYSIEEYVEKLEKQLKEEEEYERELELEE